MPDKQDDSQAASEPQVRSSAAFCRIHELIEECRQLERELCENGQYVASHGMDDAIDGLRKCVGCWNSGIKW